MGKLDDILFYSGTFNPIHCGHLQIVLNVKNKLNLKKIILVPTYNPYHKETNCIPSFESRLEMTKIAVQDMKDIEVSDIDKRANDGNSYSFNTVTLFIQEFFNNKDISTDEKLNFLIGADAFEKLESWYKYKELAKLVKFIIVSRPDYQEIDQAILNISSSIPNFKYEKIYQNYPISSSKIRENIKNDLTIKNLVPNKVATYILENKLYK